MLACQDVAYFLLGNGNYPFLEFSIQRKEIRQKRLLIFCIWFSLNHAEQTISPSPPSPMLKAQKENYPSNTSCVIPVSTPQVLCDNGLFL
jgi:hypothetical protein